MPVRPAIFSATAMPSSSALCASIGPGMTSPIAQMPGDGGAEIMVDLDLAALVELEPGRVEPETLGVRPAADRDQHGIGVDRLGGAAGGRLDGDGGAGAVARDARSPSCRSCSAKPCFLKILAASLADLAVHAGQDLVEIFDDRDLRRRAASTPSRAPARSRRRRSRSAAAAPWAAPARRWNRRRPHCRSSRRAAASPTSRWR